MLDRLKTLFRPAETKASRTARLIALENTGRARWTPRDYAALAREGYLANAVVHRAVKLVAETLDLASIDRSCLDRRGLQQGRLSDCLQSPASSSPVPAVDRNGWRQVPPGRRAILPTIPPKPPFMPLLKIVSCLRGISAHRSPVQTLRPQFRFETPPLRTGPVFMQPKIVTVHTQFSANRS